MMFKKDFFSQFFQGRTLSEPKLRSDTIQAFMVGPNPTLNKLGSAYNQLDPFFPAFRISQCRVKL